MKHIFTFLVAFLLCSCLSAQLIQGTLKQGAVANSVIISIKPNATFSGSITGINLTLQVPTSVSPTPTVSIRTNFLETNIPSSSYTQATTTESGFTNYLFLSNPAGTPAINFTNSVEVDVLEVEFTGGPANVVNQVRLASLPSGGSNAQLFFYVEIGGVDRTNQSAMFYGATASNDPAGYGGYSFVTTGATLPVKWLSFSAVRQTSDVVINWGVANEENVAGYELEVSTNGTVFDKIASKGSISGSGPKSYDYLDKQVARYNSKWLYYRVKQIDIDGSFTYTPVKSVRLDTRGQIALYPNPARDGFTLNIPYLQADQKRIQLLLVNGAGQILENRTITRQQAVNYYYSLNPSISSGDYLLKIFEDGVLTETKQVLIKK